MKPKIKKKKKESQNLHLGLTWAQRIIFHWSYSSIPKINRNYIESLNKLKLGMYTLCISDYTPVKSQGKQMTFIVHWELRCKSIHDHFALIPNVVGCLLQKGHTHTHTHPHIFFISSQ